MFDTNVLAYALLNVPEYREEAATSLLRAEEVLVPDSLRTELANVIWQWLRARGLSSDTGVGVLRDAEALLTKVVPANVLTETALRLSMASGQPVYDTVFVALAAQQGTKVITYDKKLLKRFPDQTISPADFLESP